MVFGAPQIPHNMCDMLGNFLGILPTAPMLSVPLPNKIRNRIGTCVNENF